jgi:hypothetical protein
MSSTQGSTDATTGTPPGAAIPMRLEVVVVPVTDTERANRFTRAWDGGSTATSQPVTTIG